MIQLDNKHRYLQIAFNYDAMMVRQILPSLPLANNIFIEAGTPYIKQEGMGGIRLIRRLWRGVIIADIKVSDGAAAEVAMAHAAGANGITALGSAPTPTLRLFIETCKQYGMLSMVDMLGIDDPLKVLRPLQDAPDVIVLHRGRDEELATNDLIQYRHINRIHSKFPSLISIAGGVDIKEARSAIFNGANIVVANLVHPQDNWTGISTASGVKTAAINFLETIA
jgi:3-keto-L-gulonate-6-phosphate decarboxylase